MSVASVAPGGSADGATLTRPAPRVGESLHRAAEICTGAPDPSSGWPNMSTAPASPTTGLAMLALACWLGSHLDVAWIRDNFLWVQLLQVFAQPMAVLPLLMLATGGLAPQDGPFASAWFNTVKGFAAIVDGECDDIPEWAFFNVGTLDDAKKKYADKLAEEKGGAV